MVTVVSLVQVHLLEHQIMRVSVFGMGYGGLIPWLSEHYGYLRGNLI